MKIVKILLWILAFVVVGVGGFMLGAGGGAVVGAVSGGIGGALMGVCKAAAVAGEKGILTPEQQAALINGTAEALRTEYADLLKSVELDASMRLTPENCPKLMETFRPKAS
ncbi:MAG: hypothetical protein U1E14_03025 [Geminicoccaceae bacterium]